MAPIAPSAISRLMAGGSWSIADAAQGCQAIPIPSTKVLPSQNVRPDKKQIYATSNALSP